MKGYRKYFGKKILWFFITLVVAVILNFILPRLMPADPVAAITGKMAQGVTDASTTKEIYERFQKVFGTDKPIVVQFFIFVKNALRGDFGFSFSQYPRTVSDIIGNAIPWTLALQLPVRDPVLHIVFQLIRQVQDRKNILPAQIDQLQQILLHCAASNTRAMAPIPCSISAREMVSGGSSRMVLWPAVRHRTPSSIMARTSSPAL